MSFRAFELGRNMSLKECSKMEYNLEYSMMFYYSYNFRHGVPQKLQRKNEYKWIPSSVYEVSSEMVEILMSNKSGLRLSLDFLK